MGSHAPGSEMGVPSARHSVCTHQRRAQTARRRTSPQGINATYGSVRAAISDGRPYRDSDPLVSQINWDWQTWVHFPIRGFFRSLIPGAYWLLAGITLPGKWKPQSKLWRMKNARSGESDVGRLSGPISHDGQRLAIRD